MNVKATSNLEIISRLQEVESQYDAFIIDIWGVIHDGISAYPSAVKCINYLISSKKPIIFMSNAPRPNKVVLEKLMSLGLDATLDMILTSGDAVRIFLQESTTQPPKQYYHLGAHRNSDILAGMSINLVEDIKIADVMLLTAYIDEGEDLNQFDELLKEAASRNIPAICANPDKVVVNGDYNRYCAGILAEKYIALGGAVSYYGKPHLSIYTMALQHFQKSGAHDNARILMIGDTLETDIQGATNAGIHSVLVLTGNMANLLKEKEVQGESKAHTLGHLFTERGIQPTHILECLDW